MNPLDLLRDDLEVVDLAQSLEVGMPASPTRRRLLAEAAEERMLLVPAHLPGHGAAEVTASGDGYEITRWAGFRPVRDGEAGRSGRGDA